jgi:hypothetical protein
MPAPLPTRPAAIVLLAAALVAGVPAAGARAECKVWTVTDTRRVLRDEGPPPGAAAETRLAAARNESRSFQVLLRADEPVGGIRVAAADLAGPDGAVLKAAHARLYRQHQIHITNGTYRHRDFKPNWYPDPLIPFDHPLTRGPLPAGAGLKAAPFDLPAGETHGFWVDQYVPADARPGAYRGALRVTADGGAEGRTPRLITEVPVTLTVWDFALPQTPALRTEFGSPAGRLRTYYRDRARAGKEQPPADYGAVEDQCAAMLAEHRINATPPGQFAPKPRADGTMAVPKEQVDALRAFVDRYHINALQVPHPGGVVKDPVAERDKLLAWLKAYDRAAADLDRPQVLFYTYLKDEPNDAEAYKYVQTWGKAVRQARSVVKVLVVEQATPQDEKWGDLYGAVDIWCPLFSLFKAESEARRRALGEDVWTYTALCQGDPTPWWHIDWPLLNYRAAAWIAWRYRITGLLYWGGMAYWKEVEDPWTDAWTYGHKDGTKGLVFNGEGTLVYPGRAAGYDGIAPSLRLKALRDSIQDYEYMAILDRAGKAGKAQSVVEPLARSWYEWQQDPAAYEKARAALAALILER